MDPSSPLRAPALSVLVAEDEVLVSMLIEDELRRAGYAVVGPFSTCAAASRWLAVGTPDLAVLDHELSDGPCTDVAVALRERGIPFVVLSASEPRHLPAPFQGMPWMAKPSSLERLPAVILSLLAGRSLVPAA